MRRFLSIRSPHTILINASAVTNLQRDRKCVCVYYYYESIVIFVYYYFLVHRHRAAGVKIRLSKNIIITIIIFYTLRSIDPGG